MTGKKKKSVQSTLQQVFFLLILVVFLAYIGYFILSESTKRRAQAFETVSRDAETAATFMDEELRSINMVMQNVAYSNLIKEHFLIYLKRPEAGTKDNSSLQNIQVLTDLLTAIIGPSRPVDQIYLYSLENGYVGVGLDNTKSEDTVRDMPWYEDLMESENNRLFFSDQDQRLEKYFSYKEGSQFLTVCSVYLSSFYKPQGVIEVKHSITSLTGKLKRIDTGAYGEKIYIYDQVGNLIYTTGDETLAGSYLSAIKDRGIAYDDTSHHVSFGKRTHLFVDSSSYSGVTVIIAIDKWQLYKPLFDFIKMDLLIFVLFIVLVLILSYVVARRITNPVKKMYNNITALHEGGENLLTDSLEEIDTSVIELDTLYSAVIEMHNRTRYYMNREIVLNNQRLQSQILALQSQMNPHFLFNSLATISAMADEGMDQEVITMCQTMSRILRYISSDKEPLVPIREDVAHAEDFLACMKMRYDDDLTYEIDLPPEILDLRIPKLCLQLIVENAIKFATKSVRPPWQIRITGEITEHEWTISVQDNGTGFSKEDLEEINQKIDYINEHEMLPSLEINGMGLMNIYIRFKTLYHGRHIFRISQAPEGGAIVTIGGDIQEAEQDKSLGRDKGNGES